MYTLFRYRELIRNLVVKDLKIKYRDSTIGLLWSLVNPLLLILVYSFVFSHILKAEIANFSYFLLTGILPWNFFAQSIMMATGSIVDNGGLIRKVAVPMAVFPVATVLFNLAQFGLALLVFLPIALVSFQLTMSWATLWFFPLLLMHLLFTVGLSFIVSTATVFYRDVRHFVEIGLMLLFWLTPIIYEIRSIPEPLRSLIYLNPQTFFILTYQDIFYRQTVPASSRCVILIIVSMASLWVGYRVNQCYKVRFAEEV
jgi:homopolymeric O-antigen transport system permease protein